MGFKTQSAEPAPLHLLLIRLGILRVIGIFRNGFPAYIRIFHIFFKSPVSTIISFWQSVKHLQRINLFRSFLRSLHPSESIMRLCGRNLCVCVDLRSMVRLSRYSDLVS